MVQFEPTHSVKHVNGWEVNLSIAPTHQAQLKSRDAAELRSARDSICIRFKKACQKKYPSFRSDQRIEWGQLTLTPLPPMVDRTVYPRVDSPKGTASTPVPDVDRHCCDDDNCRVCDDGNHQWCRKGCTLFSRR